MKQSGLLFVLLAGLLVAPPAGAAKKAAAATAPDDFVDPGKIHTLHLTVTREAWDLMQPTRRPRPMPLYADSIPAPTTRPTASRPAEPPAEQRDDRPKPPAVEGEKLPPNNFGYEYVYVKAHLN